MYRIRRGILLLLIVVLMLQPTMVCRAEDVSQDEHAMQCGVENPAIDEFPTAMRCEKLADGEMMTLDAYPWNLKKGITLSFHATFDSFSALTIGKGYDSYRGDWLRIDNQDVTWVHFENEEEIVEIKPHETGISEYITVAVGIDDDSVCTLMINSTGGSAVVKFKWRFEQNGAPFVFGDQTMYGCRFTAIVNDISKSIWLFGDSYFGFWESRIMGQMKTLGFTDNCLICGIAGCGSGSAYQNNLCKLLDMGGRPRIVGWCLGMNDSVEDYQESFDKLVGLSNRYGFEIIPMTIPIVPDRTAVNDAINAIIRNSGYRCIDACAAVGADRFGNWYPDYLASDNIHPTELGASAIAARFLVDLPELMEADRR